MTFSIRIQDLDVADVANLNKANKSLVLLTLATKYHKAFDRVLLEDARLASQAGGVKLTTKIALDILSVVILNEADKAILEAARG